MAQTSGSPSRPRILVADDDQIFIDILRWALDRWGFDPVIVSDGAAAWEMLKSPAAPRLALLDWEMPGKTGPELCTLARDLKRPLPTYCILLTVHSEAHAISGGLEAGAHDFLAKPMHHLQLKRRLAVWSRLIELEEKHGEPGLPPG
jgi:sigma-B regulation protein RsbU (phosphoserine phosphatase)